MLEKYYLFWEEEKIGVILYDTSTNSFEAFLLNNIKHYPKRLFWNRNTADDMMVKNYINSVVIPKDRENIDEILKSLNLKQYSAWGIYKALNGRNSNDSCSIKMIL